MTAITRAQLIAFCGAIYETRLDGAWANIEELTFADAGIDGNAAHAWALISACNPMSVPLDDAENQLRHASLRGAIDASGVICHPGRGRAPDFSWVEDSWLVLAPLAQVDAWARAFEQHAVYLPPQHGHPAGLRIYSAPADGNHAPSMGNLRLEWVGCVPPPAT